jgi:rare lipoprotein A
MNARQIFAVLVLCTLIYRVARADAGVASWYGYECAGRTMANRRTFNPEALSCASWWYPLGTRLLVTNVHTGASVNVTVTDRGPAKRLGRIIDLSSAAYKQLSDLKTGLIRVTVTP